MKVGIIGAGQLAKMLAEAAKPLGIECVAYSRTKDTCAQSACPVHYDTGELPETIIDFTSSVNVVTFETENIERPVLDALLSIDNSRPQASVIEVAQNRVAEKALFKDLGIETAETVAIRSASDLEHAFDRFQADAILKTARFGYDGKGQWRLSPGDNIQSVYEETRGQLLVLEKKVPFERELAICATRSPSGDIVYFSVTETHHAQGILDWSLAPAPKLSEAKEKRARSYVTKLLEHFSYVGTLALEMFDVGDKLLANEIAPRVHNSGHWTMDGASASQFENHIRAICNLPLRPPETEQNTLMLNLLGTAPQSIPNSCGTLHLYGKEPRPGRKLGHINKPLAANESAQDVLKKLRDEVRAPSAV